VHKSSRPYTKQRSPPIHLVWCTAPPFEVLVTDGNAALEALAINATLPVVHQRLRLDHLPAAGVLNKIMTALSKMSNSLL
jgi:hypothetical protein